MVAGAIPIDHDGVNTTERGQHCRSGYQKRRLGEKSGRKGGQDTKGG